MTDHVGMRAVKKVVLAALVVLLPVAVIGATVATIVAYAEWTDGVENRRWEPGLVHVAGFAVLASALGWAWLRAWRAGKALAG